MAGKGGQIGAELTLDTSKFAKGLEEANKKASEWTEKIQGAIGNLGGGNLGGVFGLLTSGAGFSGIATMTGAVGLLTGAVSELVQEYRHTAEAGHQLVGEQNRMAARFQTSAADMGMLQAAAARYGVSMETASAAMGFFFRQLEHARRQAGPARELFASLGIDREGLRGANIDVWIRAMNTLSRLSATTGEDVSRNLFGRAGGDAMRLIAFRSGPGGLRELQEHGQELGAIPSASQARSVQEIDRLRAAAEQRTREMQHAREVAVAEEGAQRLLEAAAMDIIEQRRRGRSWLGEVWAFLRSSPQGFEGLIGRNERDQVIAELRQEQTAIDQARRNARNQGRPNAEGIAAAQDRYEARQGALRITTDVQGIADRWDEATHRLADHVHTLGMNNFEIQRYRLNQDIAHVNNQLQSQDLAQLTVQEQERLRLQVRNLESQRDALNTYQEMSEWQQERLAQMNTEQRIAEAISHQRRRDVQARTALTILEQAEHRLGLDRPTPMVRALTRGSAQAINFINEARLRNEFENRSVEQRLAAVQQIEDPQLREVARALREMTGLLERNLGRPASVN
jgi:hypothetical protein